MVTVEPSAPLRSRLGVPVTPASLVVRSRLRDRLDGARTARLVLVSAPAGFGKTSVLADWVGHSRRRSGWLALDRGDNDIVRFSTGLVELTAGLDGAPDRDAARHEHEPITAEEALARTLASIADGLVAEPAGVIVVLDDYHLIVEPAIHALVAALVERLPAGATVAIGTRADPRLPLARLRARAELLELRADDLRFRLDEAGDMLRSAGVPLDEAELSALTDRTEGWAAALRLASVSLQGRPDRAAAVRRFGASHRFVLDYVTDEVIAGLAPSTQEFLLRTSILERLSGPLCDAVTGRSGGQERLEELERLNLLILPLDEERRWFRYHALFAEILRNRLRAQAPDELPDLHARASAWHEERTNDDEAVHHALASGEPERMARCVANACGRRINAGHLATVRAWLEALPVALVRGHAQLAAAYAWYWIIEGDVDEASAWLATAQQAFDAGRDGGPAMRAGLPTQLAMLRSQIAGHRGDTVAAVRDARAALDLVPGGLPAEVEAILRGTASVLLAAALLGAGELEAAVAAYRSGLPDLRAGGNRLATGRAVADLARIAIQRGDALGAIRLCEAELAHDDGSPGNGAVWAALARARLHLGQLQGVSDAAGRALELGIRAGDEPVVQSATTTLQQLDERRRRDGNGARRMPGTAPGLIEPLTERELEVLRLVARGRSNSQIAAELFVTVGTVKSHLHTISGKLGAANRVEAAALGRDLGLLS